MGVKLSFDTIIPSLDVGEEVSVRINSKIYTFKIATIEERKLENVNGVNGYTTLFLDLQ